MSQLHCITWSTFFFFGFTFFCDISQKICFKITNKVICKDNTHHLIHIGHKQAISLNPDNATHC